MTQGLEKRLNERIRTRAYFKWLNRRDDSQASPEADWLAAEEEELFLSLVAAAKAAIPQPFVFTQDDLWFGSAKLADLFWLAWPKTQAQTRAKPLLSDDRGISRLPNLVASGQ